jgi:hypothetical protein
MGWLRPLALGLVGLGLALGLSTPAQADCVTGGRSIQSFQQRQGLVLTFVRGDVTRLTVSPAQSPDAPLWSGTPFPGLTIRRPDKQTEAVQFVVTPDTEGCALRVDRF